MHRALSVSYPFATSIYHQNQPLYSNESSLEYWICSTAHVENLLHIVQENILLAQKSRIHVSEPGL